jgi:hypothetical protein
MSIIKNLYVLTIAVLLLSLSCERKGGNKETKVDQVKKEMDIITDSLNTSWHNMDANDSTKLADVERLLKEISYTSDYDVTLHDSLLKQLPVLKSKKYDESLNLDAMDAYDEMTDAYIRKVYELKNKSKEISQHDLAERLVEDINKANSVETTVTLRKRYDNWAKTYNAYLQKHKNQLEKLGEPYASMKERAEIIK